MLSAVCAIGASGLYAIARHSGRPLVERFGRYVHLVTISEHPNGAY
jgi:membrane protein DedA with SNARE-associated domain